MPVAFGSAQDLYDIMAYMLPDEFGWFSLY